MYRIASERYIDGSFLEDSFYWYSQKIISVGANKSLIIYNFMQRAQKNTEDYLIL